MMFTRRTCLALGATLALSACFGGSSPQSVVEGFYEAIAKGDVDKAMTFLALEQVSANEMMMVKGKVQMMVGMAGQKFSANGGLDGVTLQEQTPQGEDKLRVKVQVRFKNGKSETEGMNLLKQKDGWKIKL